MSQTSDALKSILDHGWLGSIKDTHRDTSKLDLRCNTRGRKNRNTSVLLHYGRNDRFLPWQIYFNYLLLHRSAGIFALRIRKCVTGFSEFTDPVVEISRIYAFPLTPLIVRKATLATFHDELDLLIPAYTL
ncbi:MAG: hypothetical protein J1E98_13135 [Lachnospiraceae bacterium]|nr:hypothetical protein [Lachnospiraceae bacterium]